MAVTVTGAGDRDGAVWGALLPSTRRVALEVLRKGPLARTELARRLDLSTASLTRITKPLVEAGVLRELPDVATGTGGRPAQPLDVDAGLQCFAGIKLTGDHAFGVLTNLRADILEADVSPIDSHDPDAVVAQLVELVGRLAGPRRPTAVGVGIGGVVRDFDLVSRAPFLGWRDVTLGTMLRDALDCPAAIDNDLLALMEAERWFGDGRDVERFAVLTIGASVGGGLVVHDEVVRSTDAGIGLLGHFPLDPLGPTCSDGHRGCAHSLMSMDAVRSHASLALGRHVTYAEALDLAEAGDPVADQIVGVAARGLGTLIAAVANIAMPERVILTGEGIRLAEIGWERLVDSAAAGRNPEASALDISVMPDDPSLWARGAASMAIQRTVLDDLGWWRVPR